PPDEPCASFSSNRDRGNQTQRNRRPGAVGRSGAGAGKTGTKLVRREKRAPGRCPGVPRDPFRNGSRYGQPAGERAERTPASGKRIARKAPDEGGRRRW